MAVENMNTLNTRIKLKYDTYANWLAKNPVLLEGEVAIATIPAGTTVQTGDNTTMQHLPNVVIKVGQKDEQGELQPYAALPFVSALAADVYGWAKKPVAPKLSELTDIGTELEDLVGDIIDNTEKIQDTDTQYTIQSVAGSTYKFELMKKNKGDEDTAFAHVCFIDLSEIDTRLDALEDKVGAKTVSAQIGDALAPLALTKLESAEGSGKVLSYIEQSNGLVTAEMRELKKEDIPNIDMAQVTDLDKEFAKKQNNLTFTDDYNAESSVITTKEYVDDLITDSLELNNSDAEVAGQFVVAAKQENGLVAVSRRALASTDFANDVVPMDAVNGLAEEFDTKEDKLAFMSAYNKDTNKVATAAEIKAVNDAIGLMDLAKVEATSGKIISYVEQADGKVTAAARNLETADFKDGLINQSAVINLVDDLGKKQDNLVWADGYAYNAETNKAATVEFVNDAVAGLNGAMHFVGAVATAEEVAGGLTLEQALADKGIADPKGGDVVLFGYDEYVYNATTQAWVALGNESIYQTKADADLAHQAINAEIAKKQDILGFEGTYNKDSNKVVTKSAMDDAIALALDIDEASKKADGQVVLGVSQADGRISVEHGALTSAHFADDVVPQAAVNGLAEALADKQDNLSFMTAPTAENKVATKAEIDAIDATITAMDLAQVDATSGHILTGLKQEDGKVTATTRELATADFKDGLINQSAIIGLAQTLADADTAAKGYAATAESNAIAAANGALADAIGNIDFAVTAEEGKFVTGFTVEDGKLTASTTSSVDAKHLTQAAGDYLVFDCGSASVNI